MPSELPPELRQVLAASSNGPVEVIDPVTKKVYILVPTEIYERVQALLGDEGSTIRDMSGLLADLAPEDWEDAASYDSPEP